MSIYLLFVQKMVLTKRKKPDIIEPILISALIDQIYLRRSQISTALVSRTIVQAKLKRGMKHSDKLKGGGVNSQMEASNFVNFILYTVYLM